MNAVLLCPGERPGLDQLRKAGPLALVPMLGQSLVEHWLDHLARLGAKHVRVLAPDRPDLIRAVVGDGSRWGLQAQVLPERDELTVEHAFAKYSAADVSNSVKSPEHVFAGYALPGINQAATDYESLIAGLKARLTQIKPTDRIGIREVQPGIWVGLRSKIHPRARVHAPCWIGENAWIGPDAVIGPNSVIEDRVFVDRGAWIEDSLILPETYVGEVVEVRSSIASANRLVHCKTGSAVVVPDEFLLSGLKRAKPLRLGAGWAGRIAAMLLLQVTVPFGVYALVKSSLIGLPAFRRREAVLPFEHEFSGQPRTITYYEMNSTNRWLKRWPQLWNVACGEFSWVGNRPLKPEQANQLKTDFEKLWLNAPLGFVSLADAEFCFDRFDEQSRAHSAFYATCRDWRLDYSILTRFAHLLWRRALDKSKEELTTPVPAPVPESSRVTIQ